ncbi:Uncharacterised protein [Klebsiella pneumoniae]|nr:Uncharacterised protein [Klebsiella pneumoniae]CAC9189671.1 Uncharacterised protein [Klebsiella pneumoniae]SXE36229.1 Uncharacterised protein [Klebsiella variicola]
MNGNCAELNCRQCLVVNVCSWHKADILRKATHERASASSIIAFTLKMVCRVVSNSRAIALILFPSLRRKNTAFFCSSSRAGGRPKRFPDALARAIPACVRSSSRSRSNSATAEITCIVIFPAGLVRSTPPSARQCTRISDAESSSTVFLISMAFRPRRSSFVTIKTSPFSIRSRRRINPGRSAAATEPLMYSSISRWGLMEKPAASISRRWFSVFCSRVDTLQ